MQALVADSAPSECVVSFNTQLFALDEPAKLAGLRQLPFDRGGLAEAPPI
jgi:hypothetical protein